MYSIEQIQLIKNGGYVLPAETLQLLITIEKNLDIPSMSVSNSPPPNTYFSSDRQYKHRNDAKPAKSMLVKSTKFAALEEDNTASAPPVFKTTKFAVKTGITKQINEIRMKINNLSAATYSKNSAGIIELITQWKEESDNVEDMRQIADAVFDIVSKSKMNSDLNADLYKLCIENFDNKKSDGVYSQIFTEILGANISTLENMIETIEYADPNQDYDKYCVYSKQNSQIIGMTTFYVQCAKKLAIQVETIYSFLERLLEKIAILMREEDKVANVELIADVVFVIVESCHLHMVFDRPELLKQIVDIAGYKNRQYPSVSNRFVFKFMDMRDLINK